MNSLNHSNSASWCVCITLPLGVMQWWVANTGANTERLYFHWKAERSLYERQTAQVYTGNNKQAKCDYWPAHYHNVVLINILCLQCIVLAHRSITAVDVCPPGTWSHLRLINRRSNGYHLGNIPKSNMTSRDAAPGKPNALKIITV